MTAKVHLWAPGDLLEIFGKSPKISRRFPEISVDTANLEKTHVDEISRRFPEISVDFRRFSLRHRSPNRKVVLTRLKHGSPGLRIGASDTEKIGAHDEMGLAPWRLPRDG